MAIIKERRLKRDLEEAEGGDLEEAVSEAGVVVGVVVEGVGNEGEEVEVVGRTADGFSVDLCERLECVRGE